MSEVEWNKLSSVQYEDMVSVLLSHLNPGIRRIDGSGGDGGRDSEFPREGGSEIYQLKKFTGRMTGGRRGQVKSSLKKAAKRSPVAWHLVVPIDPTPGEQEWFEALQREYVFPLWWDGKTWLDAQMAERPFIPRYFLTDERDRVIELLMQLNQEKAAIEDVNAGTERMRALAARINELDPYYRFDIAIRNNDVSIGVVPKYEGADRDHPITVRMNLAFADTEEGRAAMREFQQAMNYGSPVQVGDQFVKSFTIDGPSGFGGIFEGGSFRLGPPEPLEPFEMPLELRAVTPEGSQVATLPITLTERTVGLRGAIAYGSDRPGAFAVEMQVDFRTQRVNLHFRFSATADHYPHDLLPALGFMRSAVPPNMIEILVGPERVPLGESVAAPDVAPLQDRYVRLVEDLARLQRETTTFFTMPPEFTYNDLRELSEGLALLDGKEIELPWKNAVFELIVAEPERFLAELSDKEEGMAFFTDGDAEVSVAGHTLPLGKMRTYSPAARVSNLEEVRAVVQAPPSDEEELVVRVELEALEKGTFKLKLLPD